ncbi:uncharacterized protein LOC106878877 [Octopus bimaculoides]|uniref:uncharacterized protein LOC106878877 n=1 Tax=Octopus bimaculoides TaxID=37653 RepID=UPI00071C21D0|nr:uncharacterized protein LOC106878877 [Octopus bimaculoides]|eukprot:XP_014783708.1 PREDICTED: uncharacterized protein LOC106878877 [Octopus bimaculoides]
MKIKCPRYEFTQPEREKTQTEEENIVDQTEESKERQKCETEETKEKNNNRSSSPKKRKKHKSKKRSIENKKEIGKPETNNVREKEERTDKDVKYKGILIKYKNEQMDRKIAKLKGITRVKMQEACVEKCILIRGENYWEYIKEFDENVRTKRVWLVETPPPRTDYLQLIKTEVTVINGRKITRIFQFLELQNC